MSWMLPDSRSVVCGICDLAVATPRHGGVGINGEESYQFHLCCCGFSPETRVVSEKRRFK